MTWRGARGLRVAAALAVVVAGVGQACGWRRAAERPPTPPPHRRTPASGAAKVTFVELGADSCVPCKEMKPVMAGVQKTFGDQLKIVFYDVWEDDAPAREYGISMIPTQVFLDEGGVEFHRHTGFYPQEEIEALLVEQGLSELTTP